MMRKKKIAMLFLSIGALSCIVGCGSQTTQSKQEFTTIEISKINTANREIEPDEYNEFYLKTAEVYKQYITVPDINNISISMNDYSSDQNLENYKYTKALEIIKGTTTVYGYPPDEFNSLQDTLYHNLNESFEADGASMTFDEFIQKSYGQPAKQYADNYTKDYLLEKMILSIVASNNNITVSADEIKRTGEDLAQYYDYKDYQEIINEYSKSMNAEVGYELLYEKTVDLIVSKITVR